MYKCRILYHIPHIDLRDQNFSESFLLCPVPLGALSNRVSLAVLAILSATYLEVPDDYHLEPSSIARCPACSTSMPVGPLRFAGLQLQLRPAGALLILRHEAWKFPGLPTMVTLESERLWFVGASREPWPWRVR